MYSNIMWRILRLIHILFSVVRLHQLSVMRQSLPRILDVVYAPDLVTIRLSKPYRCRITETQVPPRVNLPVSVMRYIRNSASLFRLGHELSVVTADLDTLP